MPNIICQTVKADMFFNLDKLHADCCKYAILNCCSFETAQYKLLGRIIFAD